MKTSKPNANQKTIKSRAHSILILISAVASSFLLGCATQAHRTRQTLSIIDKEVVLIERLKAERMSESVTSAVQSNEILTQTEAHLLSALDELLRANKTIQNQILSETKEDQKNVEN